MTDFLGGLFAAPQPTTISGLLNPANSRRAMFSNALMQAGLGLLNPDPRAPNAWRSGIGNALAGAQQGMQQGREDYFRNGLFDIQLQDMQRQHDQQDAQTKAINELIPTLPANMQSFARAYPDQFAQAYMKAQLPQPADPYTLGKDQVRYGSDNKPVAYGPTGTPDHPAVETFYDEKTGQSYKGQWNPKTQTWDRVGGNKADENGITITNPDGTVTQIGGSGGQRTTESDRQAQLLINQLISGGAEQKIMSGFDGLASVQNTVGNAGGTAGRAIMTDEGQTAADAIKNVVANWLYVVSGATANPGEVATQAAMVTPTALDGPEAKAAKRVRLQAIIDTMKARGTVQTGGQQPQGATTPKVRVYNPATGKLE